MPESVLGPDGQPEAFMGVPHPDVQYLARFAVAERAVVTYAWMTGWATGHAAAESEAPGAAPAKTPRRRTGPVEVATKADLVALGLMAARGTARVEASKDRPGRGTLAALALVLARNVDASEHPPTIAKLVSELRAVLGVLAKEGGGGDDDDADAFGRRMGAPVGDTTDPGTGDPRPEAR